MVVVTYTKTGNKATTAATLDKAVFGVDVKNHELLKQAYRAYLANRRVNLAKTKKRGEVRGGGQKPWRQKGTGRARFGSSRNPLWVGGGVAFGPTGQENYSLRINARAKQTALKQALSLAAKEDRIKVIDAIDFSSGKVKSLLGLLAKIEVRGRTLLVIASSSDESIRSVRNIPSYGRNGLVAKIANTLNVYHVLNADTIVIEKPALEVINKWLGVKHD